MSKTVVPPTIFNKEDIQFEQTLVYDLNSVKTWCLYLTHVRSRMQARLDVLFDSADPSSITHGSSDWTSTVHNSKDENFEFEGRFNEIASNHNPISTGDLRSDRDSKECIQISLPSMQEDSNGLKGVSNLAKRDDSTNITNNEKREDAISHQIGNTMHKYTKKTHFIQEYYYAFLKEAAYINFLFERALFQLPGSYKLWWKYIHERIDQIQINDKFYIMLNRYGSTINFETYFASRSKAWKSIFSTFDRSLRYMHKMPLIWLEYIKYLNTQGYISQMINIINRALQALPVSHHEKIWRLCLKFIPTSNKIPRQSILRLIDRYMQLNPQYRLQYVDILLKRGWIDDAIRNMLYILNDSNLSGVKNISKFDLWKKLCKIISDHPNEIHEHNVENIIRGGLIQFQKFEVAHLWCSLATHYIRLGEFEKSRDIFEEGIQSVNTVRDFSIIFDTYVISEEEILNSAMEIDADEDLLHIQLSRLENLLERRKILLNFVKLRQNPNNVAEWHECVRLHSSNPSKVVKIYTDAFSKIDPKQSQGQVASLWISFAKLYYTEFNDLNSARTIFEKAILEPFTTIGELAEVWKAYIELEICCSNLLLAKELVCRALKYTNKDLELYQERRKRGKLSQQMLFLNIDLWCLKIDIEECTGNLASLRDCYEETIDLKIATPEMILNYAQVMESHKYFEESFKAYERSINLFTFPQNYILWSTYISKFILRYKGTQVERTRDLFEHVLRSFPHRNDKEQHLVNIDPYYTRDVYLLYAQFEEQFGIIKRALSVYERGIKSVPINVVTDLYIVYINRVSEYYGVNKTREIYEDAILNVPRNSIQFICLRYVELEKKLGDIDRARAIFMNCAKYCNPETETLFWEKWEEFEEEFVDFESYRDMLRVKNSVSMAHSSAISFATDANVDAVRVSQAIREGNLEEMKDIIKFHDEK